MATKDERTLLIKHLLEHYSLDPSIYFVNYPDEEMEDSSSDSSDSSQEEDEEEYEGNDEGNSDLDGQLRLSDDGSEKDVGNALDQNNGNDLAARVNALADRCEAGNANLKRREERINELQRA